MFLIGLANFDHAVATDNLLYVTRSDGMIYIFAHDEDLAFAQFAEIPESNMPACRLLIIRTNPDSSSLRFVIPEKEREDVRVWFRNSPYRTYVRDTRGLILDPDKVEQCGSFIYPPPRYFRFADWRCYDIEDIDDDEWRFVENSLRPGQIRNGVYWKYRGPEE